MNRTIPETKPFHSYSIMTGQPLVTIVMPVYNAELYIRKAIDSVLHQTYTNWELVMINDSSRDRTKEIIQTFSDPRIRYFENEQNLGIVKTRNRCIEKARGKYIAVLDNDDIALSQRLEKQVAFLEANNDYGVCGSYWEIIDGDGIRKAKIEIPVTDPAIKTYQVFNNCYCASTVMMRADLVKEAGYEEGSDMAEDFNLYQRLYHQTKFASIPLYLSQYRAHGKNESFKKHAELLALRKKMDAAILKGLNIPFTEAELTLHTHFFNGNFDYFKSEETQAVKMLEQWLLKIKKILISRPGFDEEVIDRIYIKRWLQLFHSTRWLSFRVLKTSIFRNNKLKFMKYFLEFLKERVTGKINLS